MKTAILLLCWVILALAAAKAVRNKNCEHDGCVSLTYDELLKYFEDDNFTAISDEVSQQLDGDMPTEEEWLNIFNVLKNGEQPNYLNLGEQRLLFRQNQTGVLNDFSDGTKVDLVKTIYGKTKRNGRMGSYSFLNINLAKTTLPSAFEIHTATGSYMRVYFSLSDDTVTWQGTAQTLTFRRFSNGTFNKYPSTYSATKGKAEIKNDNTVAVTTNTFSFAMLKPVTTKVRTSSSYSLEFVEGRLGNVSGTIERSNMHNGMNIPFRFSGDFPREGKGNFHVLSSANETITGSHLPLPIDIEIRSEGYTSFDGSRPFSNENLPSIFNSQFWAAVSKQ